jgi:hypothetical protein
MYRLIQMMGFVLADPAQGEAPTPPLSLLRLSASLSLAAAAADGKKAQHTLSSPPAPVRPDPLIAAAESVFTYINYENAQIQAGTAQPHDSERVSPLVAQTAVWFLTRWLASYLMPDTNNIPIVSTRLLAVGGQSDGREVWCCVRLTLFLCVCVFRFPFASHSLGWVRRGVR